MFPPIRALDDPADRLIVPETAPIVPICSKVSLVHPLKNAWITPDFPMNQLAKVSNLLSTRFFSQTVNPVGVLIPSCTAFVHATIWLIVGLL
ncbi:hypothetical protein ABKN59_009629 [Abortiporus biennis]